MEYTEFKYSLKVWLTSVVVAPVIMLICNYAVTSAQQAPRYYSDPDLSFGYSAFVIFGGIFSVPTYIFFYLFIKITVNYSLSIVRIKSIISVLGVALTVGTFELFFSSLSKGPKDEFFYLMVGNCLCIGWFSWFYKLIADEKIKLPDNDALPELNRN
jgi:hypothetical protein